MNENYLTLAARLEAIAAELRAVPAPSQPAPPAPLLVSIRAAAQMTGLSEWAVRRMLDDGRLPEERIGSRRLIPRSALEDFGRPAKAS